ncbi:MAG TPA: glycosyltransferase family 39 protein [Rhodanobacteraceae bacterium]|nr:glycosyltransferase family 39 protein [Rhodanobacteraceae bacterium]
MMRLPFPVDAAVRSGERHNELLRAGLLAAAALLLVLRVYCALTSSQNSDEPQHLHVVWAWTQGLLPYRDVFDNHAPLFQLLSAPLFAWLGERADIVASMRLAMIPLYFAALGLTWFIARTLWCARIGIFAALLAATAPIFFVVSVQFRPDDLWMVTWLAAIAVAIAPGLARHRAAWIGFLVGTSLAVSLKTLPLIATGALAWLTVLAIDHGLRELASRQFAQAFAIGLLCTLIVPAGFAAFFASAGAWREAIYCLFTHNVAPELDDRMGGLRMLWPLVGYPLAVVAAIAWRKRTHDPARWRAQCGVLLATLLYLLVLYGFWPLVTHQDLLPAIPLVAVGVAAAVFRGGDTARAHRGLGALFVAICLVNLATGAVPFHNEIADEETELARVLRLTRPGDYVMDAKGEIIYRRRPVYWVMEGITVARMRDASIADDISDRLAATGAPIVIMDRLPPRDAAFVERNYLPIAPAAGLIRVAGQPLGEARAGEAVEFDVAVPAEYALVTPGGGAEGMLDGTAYSGERVLAAGRHAFVASADSRLALVWAPALRRGLGERELFAATGR